MIQVIGALIPIFLVIALGFVLRRSNLMGDDIWRSAERLTYFVLFPSFLFAAIAFADFKDAPVDRLAILLTAAMLLIALIITPFRSLMRLDGPAYSSLFQGSVRWNSYVALGAIVAVIGPQGLSLAAVAVAVMVPLANTLCVVTLMQHAASRPVNISSLALQLLKNPLIIACVLGSLVQMISLALPQPITVTIDLLGKAALPLGLLAVGASLDLSDARSRPAPLVVAGLAKLILLPTIVAFGADALSITGPAKLAAVICACVPGAPSSYILARQMGGDAPLMANITTAQTLAAMVTMPLILWVLS